MHAAGDAQLPLEAGSRSRVEVWAQPCHLHTHARVSALLHWAQRSHWAITGSEGRRTSVWDVWPLAVGHSRQDLLPAGDKAY